MEISIHQNYWLGWQKDVNPYVQQNYYSNQSSCLSSTFIETRKGKTGLTAQAYHDLTCSR